MQKAQDFSKRTRRSESFNNGQRRSTVLPDNTNNIPQQKQNREQPNYMPFRQQPHPNTSDNLHTLATTPGNKCSAQQANQQAPQTNAFMDPSRKLRHQPAQQVVFNPMQGNSTNYHYTQAQAQTNDPFLYAMKHTIQNQFQHPNLYFPSPPIQY